MDNEETGNFREPCTACSAVDWGLTEEQKYYCRSCHNVTERTVDVTDHFVCSQSKASFISRGKRKKKHELGRHWMVCEGFQFILMHQAEALLALGVCPQFKDDVLYNFWMRYLQMSKQAFTRKQLPTVSFRLGSDSDATGLSDSGTDGEFSSAASSAGWSSDDSRSSVCSGSLDASSYTPGNREHRNLMTMRKTLAFCYLSLLWVREAITLSDLHRLTAEGHIPYVNAHTVLPEEMRLYGRDAKIFRAESIPSPRMLQEETHKLAVFLELPRFPPVTRDFLLHPSLLSLKYLTEANLPDQLHIWVLRVLEGTSMGEEAFLTYEPMVKKRRLPNYDLLAAAHIIVSLKLLYRLNDQKEWAISAENGAENKRNQDESCFSLCRWYKTVCVALTAAKEKEEEDVARRMWKSSKPLYASLKTKSIVLKRRRVVEQLQTHFEKLTGASREQSPAPPTNFRFKWGDHGDGPSYYDKRLAKTRPNRKYWHTSLRLCNTRICSERYHFKELEPTLPRSYVFLLDLFSFLLSVPPSQVHREVCVVERRLIPDPARTVYNSLRSAAKSNRTKKCRRKTADVK